MNTPQTMFCPKCGSPNINSADACASCGNGIQPPGQKPLTAMEQYNLVTDIGTGLNFRWRDNLFQALAILFLMAIGVPLGSWLDGRSLPAAFAGAFVGLVVGVLLSGVILMVYRAVRHAQGKHG